VSKERSEFMDKKWNYIQYDAVAHIIYAQTKKETGSDFQNSIEQMINLWKKNRDYRKNIISQCHNAGLGSVRGVIAYLLEGQRDADIIFGKNSKKITVRDEGGKETVYVKKYRNYNVLRYREGLELSFSRLGVKLYSPSKQIELI